jgi:hypothetical protein
MRALDQLDAVVVRSRRDDLVVKAVMVQGGEAEIAGEKAAFARIVMSGVSPEHANLNGQAPRRQEIAVLKIDDAASLAAGLHDVVDRIVRSMATPAIAASGSWSWTSTPPLGKDLLVVQARADTAAVLSPTGTAPTARVDFTGMPVQGLTSEDPPLLVLGAVFAAPRLAQVLVNSLRKVVRSALEQRRLEVYMSPRDSSSAFRI